MLIYISNDHTDECIVLPNIVGWKSHQDKVFFNTPGEPIIVRCEDEASARKVVQDISNGVLNHEKLINVSGWVHDDYGKPA